MAQQNINLGAAPNDASGDTLRSGGDKINSNFTELYQGQAAQTAAIDGIGNQVGSLSATDIAGNYMPVATLAARNAIPIAKRRSGMKVYVRETDKTYILTRDNNNPADAGTWDLDLADRYFAKLPQEASPLGMRWRLGSRVFATLDALRGFYPRKMTVPAGAKVDDDLANGISTRLVGAGAGVFFKKLPPEAGQSGIRWRIGNRLLATLDVTRGFYARRMTIPASAKVDDNLTTSISQRLLSSPVGAYFRTLPQETGGGVLRFRIGNRLLGQWTKAGGMAFTRQTLPADCKVADQPTINLIDRLGGNNTSYAENANYIAETYIHATSGKKVVRSIRKSDMKQINLLSGSSYNSIVLAVTSTTAVSNAIVFFSELSGTSMYVPAEGGAIWRVISDPLFIDTWGDSLTQGAGATGSGVGQGSYPKQLQDRMGSVVTITNRGIGGQTSTHIVARQNGNPALISVSGDTIPASGSVAVTAYSTDLLFASGVSGVLVLVGTLNGVRGTLTGNSTTGVDTSSYTFTRSTPGSAVACPPNTPFITDHGVATQDRTCIFKLGRNGPAFTLVQQDYVYAIAYLKTLYKRVLVLSIQNASTEAGTGTATTFLANNATLLSTYGDSYVEVNAAPTTEEMATIGFVPDSYGMYTNFKTDAAEVLGKACGGWVFAGQPTAGDTVSVNGVTITFVSGSPSGAQVQIGADVSATAANLRTYINANPGTLAVTAISGLDALGLARVHVAAITAGTSGNSITISRVGSNITANGTVLAGGSANPIMPSGMMTSALTGGTDWLHRNNFGYALEALRVYRKIYSKGWYPTLTQQ